MVIFRKASKVGCLGLGKFMSLPISGRSPLVGMKDGDDNLQTICR
jgi:hypothetical protein